MIDDIKDKGSLKGLNYPIGAYAPGHYTNECVTCKDLFIGDKYARQCEPCAINTVVAEYQKISYELMELKKALADVKFANDKMNEILGKDE